MQISKAEKLIIAMLADIHHNAVPKGTGNIDPEFVTKVIDHHSWALKWKYSFLLSDEEDCDPEVALQVARHLNMWSTVEASFDKLSEADRNEVLTRAALNEAPQFRGYDGNNETDHFAAARTMIEDLGRFSEFANHEMNSHHPYVDRYDAMVAVMHSIERSTVGARFPLSVDELVQILTVR